MPKRLKSDTEFTVQRLPFGSSVWIPTSTKVHTNVAGAIDEVIAIKARKELVHDQLRIRKTSTFSTNL